MEALDEAQEPPSQPEKLPGASPRSGVPPPKEHQFKPGQSGNPGGFPKGAKKVKRLLKNELVRQLAADGGEAIPDLIQALVGVARDKDHKKWDWAWKQLHDMVDGTIPKSEPEEEESQDHGADVVLIDETLPPEETEECER